MDNDRKVYRTQEVPQEMADAIAKAKVQPPSIKEIVKDNKVYFLFYRQQHMYYGVEVRGEKLMFPVPLDDVMDATLLAEEKAITYMRYIRKAIEGGTLVPQC